MTCPRCGGWIFDDFGDRACLYCGHRVCADLLEIPEGMTPEQACLKASLVSLLGKSCLTSKETRIAQQRAYWRRKQAEHRAKNRRCKEVGMDIALGLPQ